MTVGDYESKYNELAPCSVCKPSWEINVNS